MIAQTKLNFQLKVSSILHKNDDNDPSFVIARPAKDDIVRRTLDITVDIDAVVLKYSTILEIKTWLTSLYSESNKNKISANHKDLVEIADDLNARISDEYYGAPVSIQVQYINYGITRNYVNDYEPVA